MKKLLVALVVAGVLSLVASSPAAAQSDTAIVKVPFKFIVGDRLLPAGSYRIAPATADWSIVSIESTDGQAKAFTQSVSEGTPATMASSANVKFANYHGQYFLQEVAVPGRDGRRIVMSDAHAETVLAKLHLSTAEPANVAK